MNPTIQTTTKQEGYELLDSGNGEKLERFGQFVLMRPDPQAIWVKTLSEKEWKEKADAFFERSSKNAKWQYKENVPKSWNIEFGGLTLKISPTAFKHTGLFPEQLSNWKWMADRILNCESRITNSEIKVLNLFGYTGGATLACAKAGALVTHVDASKTSIAWGKENQELSKLGDAQIRWILDDAAEFVRKEIKRGKKYDGILLDPPSFGHGPNGEMWKIEEHLLPLIEDCKQLLSDTPLFFLINGYSAGYSSVGYLNTISDLKTRFGGVLEHGELCLEESEVQKRLLPSGIFTRWSAL